MAWRRWCMLPAALLARHAAAAAPGLTTPSEHTHPPPPPLGPPYTPTTTPPADPPPANPYASSYYCHTPPPPAAAFHWSNAPSPLTTLLRTAVLAAVHGACALHATLNTFHLHGADRLQAAVLARPPRTALLTLSNHTSTLDDPYVLSALLPLSALLSPAVTRHGWCAADICFRRGWQGELFRLGSILPVVRGGGLQQAGVAEAVRHMADGGWVHVFPEGRCHPHGGLQPVRWGAAKLAVDALALGVAVRVVPVMHAGMEAVLPLHTYVPRVGRQVWVEVGEAVDVAAVVGEWRAGERAVLAAGGGAWGEPWPASEEALYAAVSGAMEAAMRRTERRLRQRMAGLGEAAAGGVR